MATYAGQELQFSFYRNTRPTQHSLQVLRLIEKQLVHLVPAGDSFYTEARVESCNQVHTCNTGEASGHKYKNGKETHFVRLWERNAQRNPSLN